MNKINFYWLSILNIQLFIGFSASYGYFHRHLIIENVPIFMFCIFIFSNFLFLVIKKIKLQSLKIGRLKLEVRHPQPNIGIKECHIVIHTFNIS